jgi:hypothetical protein
MNWSQQKAYMTGANGSYKTDTVKPIDDMANPLYVNENFKEAFKGGMMGSVLLGPPNFQNPNNILHNNVGERVILDAAFSNEIFIDTSLKDYCRHPDPFKFVVKFNGTDPVIDQVCTVIDDRTYSYPVFIKGDTEIVFEKLFRNVNRVVIQALFLPIYIHYKTREDGAYEKTDVKLGKSYYKYLILKINELTNNRFYCNNKKFGTESFIMKMDDDVCFHNQKWKPIEGNVAYPVSQLKNVDKFTVEILSDRAEKIYPTLDGRPHDFFGEYRRLIDKIIELQEINTSESQKKIEKLKPKLESLRLIIEYLPPQLYLHIDTIEPQIDTKVQYRY